MAADSTSSSRRESLSELWFNRDDVKRHLEALGYGNIDGDVLESFKNDLEKLVLTESVSSTTAKSSPESTKSSLESPDVFGRQKTRKAVFSVVVDENRRPIVPPHMEIQGDASFVSIEESSSPSSPRAESVRDRPRRCVRKVLRKRESLRESLSETSANISRETSDESSQCQSESRPDSASAKARAPLCPPSFIRPVNNGREPGRIRRCDPVRLYHEYREQWSQCPLPGENGHNHLRWALKEHFERGHSRLSTHRQHQISPPNAYVPPPDKKRQSLRWAVRQALAKH
ncbi:centriolar and ciliogenesis-associated protein HYLS1-like [Oscarella lobularis]|uniref:centriolar and ciliogenesis-associated protein HYLS1-like n=1 Tax=Oscarella lobularis TaxID=121494 RepID=UPI003313E06F